MTRGMFVTVIGRMADADVSRYTENAFSDVDENGYYARYIAWAQESGIINGIGGGLFAPDDTVTREQMAVIIYNAAEFVGVDVSGFNPVVSDSDEFTDDDGIGGWAKAAVYAMKNAGFISGKGGGVFDPKGTATRAEAAKILSMIAEYGE
jgi:hypothetical protein